MIRFIYHNYRYLMYQVANQILENKDLSEEAVQEAFVYILKNKHKMKCDDALKLKNVVCLITKHIAIDMLRKHRDFISLEQYPELMEPKSMENSILQRIEIQRIIIAMRKLPQKDCQILKLHLFMDYKPKEIARFMDWSDSQTRKRLQRAKEKLRKILKKVK